MEQRNKELEKLGVGVKIVCVGKKGSSYFKRRLDRFTVSGAALFLACSCAMYGSRLGFGGLSLSACARARKDWRLGDR